MFIKYRLDNAVIISHYRNSFDEQECYCNMMQDPAKAELKTEKKIKKLLKKSAWAIGAGVGMVLLRFLVAPFLGENEEAEKALSLLGWCLVLYGGVIIVSFVFLRKFIFKINIILTWVAMPVIFMKFFADAF